MILLLILAVTFSAKGQDTNSITVDINDLPPQVLAKVRMKEKTAELGEYAKWGREVGVAVNETLSAITKQSAEFAKTEPGKLTMFLVAWKVMAKDTMIACDKIIGYVIGIPLLVFGSITLCWFYRRNVLPRRYLKEIKPDKTRVYDIYNPITKEDIRAGWSVCYIVSEIILIIICSIIVFS